MTKEQREKLLEKLDTSFPILCEHDCYKNTVPIIQTLLEINSRLNEALEKIAEWNWPCDSSPTGWMTYNDDAIDTKNLSAEALAFEQERLKELLK